MATVCFWRGGNLLVNCAYVQCSYLCNHLHEHTVALHERVGLCHIGLGHVVHVLKMVTSSQCGHNKLTTSRVGGKSLGPMRCWPCGSGMNGIPVDRHSPTWLVGRHDRLTMRRSAGRTV